MPGNEQTPQQNNGALAAIHTELRHVKETMEPVARDIRDLTKVSVEHSTLIKMLVENMNKIQTMMGEMSQTQVEVKALRQEFEKADKRLDERFRAIDEITCDLADDMRDLRAKLETARIKEKEANPVTSPKWMEYIKLIPVVFTILTTVGGALWYFLKEYIKMAIAEAAKGVH